MSNINVVRKNLGPVTAYKYAVQQGYTGTEQEFAVLMASYATVAEEAGESAASAAQSAADAAASAQTLVVDDTLSVEGRAADAAVTGTKINAVTDGIIINTTGKTNLYLNVGDTVVINVSELINKVNVFIEGHTSSNVLLITKPGVYEYTASYGGYLSIYFFENTTMTANIKLKTSLYSLVGDVSELKAVNFKYETLDLEVGTIDTASGYNTSSTGSIRSVGYVDKDIFGIIFNPACSMYVYAYEVNGTYVGRYTGETFSKNWQESLALKPPVSMEGFSEFGYKYRLSFTNTQGSIETLNASTIISNIKSALQSKVSIYTVGTGGDFASFTEMLVALKNDDSKKTVYVYSGVYDIFEEMGGAEFVASLDTSQSWRSVCNTVPPNTTIIGVGDVTLKWNPTDEQIIDNDHAFLLSPLNLSGSCAIKNIKIECSNCRYGIHDETSGRAVFNAIERTFENVSVIYTASTYGTHYAYGAGHNKNSKYRFKNCLFSAAYGTTWSTHDWPATKLEKSTFEIDNCVFWNNSSNIASGIRFSSSDTTGRLDDVKINGCVFSNIVFSTEGSANVKQGYSVQTMLCRSFNIVYTQYILEEDRIAPEEYLTLD